MYKFNSNGYRRRILCTLNQIFKIIDFFFSFGNIFQIPKVFLLLKMLLGAQLVTHFSFLKFLDTLIYNSVLEPNMNYFDGNSRSNMIA